MHTYNSCYCLKQKRCWNSNKKSAFTSPPDVSLFGMFSRLWLCHAIHFMLSDLDTLNVVLEWHITIWSHKKRMAQSLMQSVQQTETQQTETQQPMRAAVWLMQSTTNWTRITLWWHHNHYLSECNSCSVRSWLKLMLGMKTLPSF